MMTVGPGPTRIGNIEEYLEKIEQLEADNAQLRAALDDARAAIKSLPADALGSGGTGGTDRYQWYSRDYLRDELLTKIDKALAATAVNPPDQT